MKKIILLSIILFLGFYSFSQNHACGTINIELDPNPDDSEDGNLGSLGGSVGGSGACMRNSDSYLNYYRLKESYIPNENTVVKLIKINLHIFQDDLGGNNWQNTQNHKDTLRQLFQLANSYFENRIAPSDSIDGVMEVDHSYVSFEIDSIYFYKSTFLNQKGGHNTEDTCFNYIKSDYPERLEGFNYYLTEADTSVVAYSGYAIMPYSFYNSTKFSAYVVSFRTYSDRVGSGFFGAKARHIAHELGHTLGLYHTYSPGETCDQDSIEYLSDVFNNGICPHIGDWGSNAYSSIDAITNNIMGGNKSSGYYSPQQVGKMQRALHIQSIASFVDCSVYSSIPMEITSDETWDFKMRVYRDIVVKTGATLTLECSLLMPPYSKIIVEKGAKLYVDGGLITSSCDQSWEGIVVEGDPNADQNLDTQGFVYIKNESTIKNARIAIKSDGGGIIKARDSYFTNNLTSIEISNYPESESWGDIYRNIFEVNDEHLFNPSDFNGNVAQISLYNIKKHTRIKGDTIRYTGSSNLGMNGISVVFSGLSITESYSSGVHYRNIFENLEKGIQILNIANSNPVIIQDSDFSNTKQGVYAISANNLIVENNTFDMGNTNNPLSYGLYIYQSQAPEVKLNSFSNGARGMQVYNIGDEGEFEIYKNTFNNFNNDPTGYKASAFIASGSSATNNQNQGMQLKCNSFSNNRKSITVKSGAIKKNQGAWVPQSFNMQSPANNRFSNYCYYLAPIGESPDEIDNAFYVESTYNMMYNYFHHNNLASSTYDVDFGDCRTVDKVYMSGSLLDYNDFDAICPDYPNAGSGGLDPDFVYDSEYSAITVSTGLGIISDINSTEVTQSSILTHKIDQGNTDGYLQDIEDVTTNTYEDLATRIGGNAGFTSDTVIAAFMRLDMKQDMTKTIALAQNSPLSIEMQALIPLAKLPQDLEDFLWSKQKGMSVRVQEELKINSLKTQKDYFTTAMVRKAILDSAFKEEDLLVRTLTEAAGSWSKVQLLNYYKANSKKNKALSLVVDMKYHNKDISKDEDYWELQKLSVALLSENTKTQQQILRDKKNYLQSVYSANTMASGIAYVFLKALGEQVASPVDIATSFPLASSNRSLETESKADQTFNKIKSIVKLYPNPVKDYLKVKYILPNCSEPQSLQIYNIEGKLVLEQSIMEEMGSERIDVSNLDSGVYILQIGNDKKQFIVK